MAQTYFATINPGLEETLLAEIRELEGKRARVLSGGVEFDATNTVFYRCAYRLRCANRLWLRVDEFRSRDAPELYNKTRRIDWARLIPSDVPVEIRAISHGSRLYHTGKIADTVTDGINAALGRRETGDADPFVVLARLTDDRCELSLDASGELLFRRGWKEDVGKAPLRESIAAAILRLVEWPSDTPLIDPFCGSGTLVVEAAARAVGLAPGRDREFAFHRWANFRPDLWSEVTTETAEGPPKNLPGFSGYDVDPDAVEAARHNAARAGVEAVCGFDVRDVADLEPVGEEPGFIVTNPPWDVRVSDPGASAIPTLLDRFRDRFPQGWKLGVVSPPNHVPDDARIAAHFKLGSISVCLWTMEQ